MERQQYDVAIVGGGIIGLSTAMHLTQRNPDLRVAVLEKEAELATHQTGHNSGVIHSGIYYRPGSHKANFCVAGVQKLIDFCDENEIEYERCGKVIVATDESELGRLGQPLRARRSQRRAGPGNHRPRSGCARSNLTPPASRPSGRRPPASPTTPRSPRPTLTSSPIPVATSSPKRPCKASPAGEAPWPWKRRKGRCRPAT